MSTLKNTALAVCLIAAVCTPRQPSPRDVRIAAAETLAGYSETSRLAKWNIRGSAGGVDCSVLLVETSMVLDDSLAEAIHYGTGAYAVVDGGVRRFTRECAFRGVVYRDRTGRVWAYGDLTRREAEEVQPCR